MKLDYNGTVQTLEEWGVIADLGHADVNKSKSTVYLRTIEDMDAAAPQFDFDGVAVLMEDDDTVVFQGYFGDCKRRSSGGKQWIEYPIHNVWWLFERLVFKQSRKQFLHYTTIGDPRTAPVLTDIYTSEVYIGEKADETYQTSGQQLVEILNWVNECWNPTRRGATVGMDASQDVVQLPATPLTEFPSVNMPKWRAASLFCSNAIINCLRYSPDRVVEFDYSTTPPTIHFPTLASATEITITLSADQEREIELSPQNARKLAGVMIHYKKVDTIDGAVAPKVFVDAYPVGITDFTPDVACPTIDLLGYTFNRVYANVKVASIGIADAVNSGSTSARKGFWLAFDSSLKADGVDPSTLVPDVAVVKDEETGATVTLADYPNILANDSAPLADWMNVVAKKVIVTANLKYDTHADPATGRHIQNAGYDKKQHQVRLILTSAITDTYSSIQAFDSGEAVPTGVAQAVYTSVSALQYAGKITLVGAAQRDDIYVGCKLKAIGPNNTYTNLLVQSVNRQPYLGITDITYGPSASLDVQERVELERVGRWRTTYNMPSGRSTGMGGSTSQVILGDKTPKENTTQTAGYYSLTAATADAGSGNTMVIKKDAGNKQFIMETVNASGVRVAYSVAGAFEVKNSQLLGSDGQYHKIYPQEITVYDGSCTEKKAIIMMCDPF